MWYLAVLSLGDLGLPQLSLTPPRILAMNNYLPVTFSGVIFTPFVLVHYLDGQTTDLNLKPTTSTKTNFYMSHFF